MTIEELGSEERILMERVAQATGLMEDKHAQLEAAGIFERYRELHRTYVQLADNTGDMEALKRAVFLQWYALAEPGCFTGLHEMDENAEARAFELLDSLAAGGELDAELTWMLPYYHLIADFYLERFDGLSAVKQISRTRPVDPLMPKIVSGSLRGRGQMGKYWLSWREGGAA